LVLGFTLYEINATHNNGFVKNNNAGSDNPNKSISTTDKVSNKNSETNSSMASDVTNTGKNEEVDIVNNNKEQIVQQQEEPTNNYHLQQSNIIGIPNLKESSKTNQDQAIFISGQKKKLFTKSVSKVNITNATPTEDIQLLVENNDEKGKNKTPLLQNTKTELSENVKLQPENTIDEKKPIPSLVSSKTKTSDTSKNNVAKNVQKNKQGKSSRFSLTPFFSPDIAWYRLQDDKVGNQPDNARELERDENHEFSSTFGAFVDYKISKHFGLQSGLTLSNINITLKPKTIYAQADNTGSIKYRINTSSGYGYILPSFSANPSIGDSLYVFTSTHSLQYVGIPLAVTYNVTKGKFKVKVLAGVSTNILARAKLETTVEKGLNNSAETVDNMQGLKKVYFSGLAGIGVDYKLTKKTALTFLPTMRFALNSINKDAPVKSYPMSFGFTVGLKIGL
jgi:hypothetical protein